MRKWRMLREEPAVGGGEPGASAEGGSPAAAVPPAEKSWLDEAPEDVKEILKTNKSLTKFKTPWEAAKAYVHLDRVHSGSIAIPKEGAPAEEWAAYHRKLGVPATPDEYGTVKDAKLLPEGMAWDEAGEAAARAELHKLNLTPAQYRGVMALYIQNSKGGNDQLAQVFSEQARAGMADLEAKWGANTKRNLALAARTGAEFGGQEFITLLDLPIPGLGKDGQPGRIGDHPAYLRFAARVGDAMLEDGLIHGGDLHTDKGSAQAELDKLMNDRKSAFWVKGPGHEEAVKRALALNEIIAGDM